MTHSRAGIFVKKTFFTAKFQSKSRHAKIRIQICARHVSSLAPSGKKKERQQTEKPPARDSHQCQDTSHTANIFILSLYIPFDKLFRPSSVDLVYAKGSL